jgi:2'-5' RNA ligase
VTSEAHPRRRLFVAAWPDEPTRRGLHQVESQLARGRGLRLVGPTRWHVTLRFLGAPPEEADRWVEQIGQALRVACTTLDGPASCELGPGTAWFTGARVLQLPVAGLDHVAATVRTATRSWVPEPPDELPFNGHLTLARSTRRRLGAAGAAGIPFSARFAVDQVDLVASDPSPHGHVYTTLVRAPLGPGPPGAATLSP